MMTSEIVSNIRKPIDHIVGYMTRKKMVECPVCRKQLDASLFTLHMRVTHSAIYATYLDKFDLHHCESCGRSIEDWNLCIKCNRCGQCHEIAADHN